MYAATKNCKASILLIILWTVLFILSKRFNLIQGFSGRGIKLIGNEYYRYFTGPLLHFNLIHLSVNIIAVFWIGYFAEQSIGSIRFFFFGVVASTLTELLYSLLCNTSENNIGGSVWAFCYIGLLLVLQLLKPDFPRFHKNTYYGSYIIGYAILGNVPFLSFMTTGTVITHLCAFLTGCILGAIGIFLKFFR